MYIIINIYIYVNKCLIYILINKAFCKFHKLTDICNRIQY